VIFADSDALNRVSKAWVPKTYEGNDLWWDETKIDLYIKKLESSWDPAKTLRMSIIDGKGWNDVQLLIPPGLLNDKGGGMGLSTFCVADFKNDDSFPTEAVNYDDWQNNIKGNRD